MTLELAITIENNNHEPILLNVEPVGADYTLLPGDEFEIWEETDPENFNITPEYHTPSGNKTFIYERDNVVTIYEFFEYEVRSKGVPIPAGYQRDWSSWKKTIISIRTAVQPNQIFDTFQLMEQLTSALNIEVIRNFRKKWTTYAVNGKFGWRLISPEEYSRLYFIWRADFFSSTSPNSHANITFEDLGEETEISIQLSGFDNETTRQKAVKFWRDEIFQPILTYLTNENRQTSN